MAAITKRMWKHNQKDVKASKEVATGGIPDTTFIQLFNYSILFHMDTDSDNWLMDVIETLLTIR